MKILVATKKPFAPEAVENIKKITADANYELEVFEKYENQQDLVNAVSDANGLIVRSDKVTEEVINAAKELKIVVRAGAGYDNVDLDAATKNDVVVMNTPGQNSNAVAELAFGMMVYMARACFNGKPGTELKGKKLGIQAYGNVGKYVGNIAKGFGMELYAYDPFIEKSVMENDGVKVVDNVEDLYKNCDYISLHIPANDKTKKSINSSLVNLLPKNATIINTARKEVIDEDQLIDAMKEREDIKYVSDIAPEKRDEFESLFGNRVFFTPKKMGAQTKEANVNAGIASIKQIIDFIEKADTTFKVN